MPLWGGNSLFATQEHILTVKGDARMTTPRPTLAQLAHHAAAQIGFTVRRWWRDATDPSVLRVEVERRLVGARPAVAELTVPIPPYDTSSRTRVPRAPRRHGH